jgi:hypothetical protein
MFSHYFTNSKVEKLNYEEPNEGVFFTPNGYTGARKKDTNLTHVNAVFADWDFKPKEGQPTGSAKPDFKQFMLDLDGLPTPTFIVESGNGWHLYWLLNEPIIVTDDNRADMIKQVEGVHRFIHERYNSDSGAMDALRLMRLPGHEHKKQPEHPFMVSVIEDNEDTRYTWDELLAAMPPVYKEVVEHAPSANAEYDVRQAAIDAWAEKGDTVTFDSLGRMVWNGQPTGTFIGRSGTENYIATTSDEYPYKGNATTYVAGVLGITTKQAYKWLIDKYGELPKEAPTVSGDGMEDIDWETLMYIKKKKGDDYVIEYLANDENIIRIFNHYKLARYDAFMNRSYLCIGGTWILRDDGSDGQLYSWLVEKFPFLAKVTARRVGDLLTYVQYRNVFDSAQDYVNSLKWDGVGRLNTWLNSVFFVPEEQYYKDIGSKWFMGLVSRILNPGCKFDSALIVQGGQNIGKSSVFLIIAGEDKHIEFTDLKVREMQQDMQGKLIVEFAEAAIFSKADSESLKSIVSRQTDTFRVPYERHARDFPRRCVFAVTANNDDILKDSTGGRRWWAVEVPDDMKCYPPKRQADIHWLRANRDQLFAEAAVRVRNGEDFRKIDDYELMRHQRSITATEQDEDLFKTWYYNLSADEQNRGKTTRQAYCQAYKNDRYGETLDESTVSIGKADEMRVGRILKKIGLEKKHFDWGNVWVPGELFDRGAATPFRVSKHEINNF